MSGIVAEPPAAAVRHLTPTVAMAGCSEMGRGPPHCTPDHDGE